MFIDSFSYFKQTSLDYCCTKLTNSNRNIRSFNLYCSNLADMCIVASVYLMIIQFSGANSTKIERLLLYLGSINNNWVESCLLDKTIT